MSFASKTVTLFAMLSLAMVCLPSAAHAQEGKVEMELGTAPGFNQIDTRDWYQLLTRLNVTNLRIAGAKPGDKIEILIEGSDRSPIYRVKGRLTAAGELIVPGGRFSIRNRDSIAKWITNLAKHGPGGPKEDTTGVTFDLDDGELRTIYKDLGQKVSFSTVGMSRPEIVTKLAEQLDYNVSLSSSAKLSLKTAGDATFELKGMTSGTALAYVIRAAGLGMAPRASAGGFEYQVAPADALKQTWPIGLPTKKRLYDLLPKAREFVDFQVNAQTPLTSALPPIAEFLDTTFLFDENLMAVAEIDPSQTVVEVPPARITLTIAASRMLGKAKLRTELRVDEAGRAFYWITPLVVPRER